MAQVEAYLLQTVTQTSLLKVIKLEVYIALWLQVPGDDGKRATYYTTLSQ
jgi:hypothetical protein